MTGLTPENFKQMVQQGKVVLDFYADWCSPCRMMEPVLEKMKNEFNEVNFFKVNVDSNQQAASTYEIRSIPTIVFLKDGQEADRVVGLVAEDDFKKKIKEAFR